MSTLSVIYAFLFYAAAFLLIVGLARRVMMYATTPTPLKIPTMPAPLTKSGAAFRVFKEVAFFESLFKSNRWIWILPCCSMLVWPWRWRATCAISKPMCGW